MGERESTTKIEHEGLTSRRAAELLAAEGPNVLPAPPRVPLWRRVAVQLRDPLVLVLLAAAVLTTATRDWTDVTVILLVIVVNTTAGVAQELKADRAIAALGAMAAPHARVLRDGRQQSLPAADVVRGDLLILAEGDVVPADATVLTAAALRVDESTLTGESVPVDKVAYPDADGAGDTVSAGTVVVRGRGRAVATATGRASAMGRIATLLVAGPALTPLQRRLIGVGRALAVATVALCSVVLALGLVRGEPVELMVVAAISLVVAAVPESLPAVVTLALAQGARRMAVRRALVRRLPAVETLGSVTVLATDKTGTLTEGRMVVRQLWTPAGTATLDGTGYRPEGVVRRDGVAVTAEAAPDVAELLVAVALCNDAALRPPHTPDGAVPDGDWTAIGDPTEAAMLTAAGKLGLDASALASRLPRLSELPFDSGRQRMTTVHRRPRGGLRIICKGAPEALLCPPVVVAGADLLARARTRAEELAREGYRVLAVAQADRTESPDPAPEQGLRLLGLVAMLDPARASAPATVAACQEAGIDPVLITGDHPATARAVAVEVGIIEHDGTVVDCRSPAARDPEVLRTASVFARATPEQKLRIIEARRAAGEVVAMTGDGVNDGPALRRADIGVAMGGRGTEVARQAADLVLADDDLGTVVAAAEEGRRVYANVRRFLLYALSGGTAEIVVMLLGPFLGLPLPLLPAQILWVNLITHGLPGVALGGEPPERNAMRHPPRPPEQSVLGAGLWQRILRVGAVVSGCTLGVALWAHDTGRPWQSMAFFALGATQLAVAVGSRSRPGTRANLALPLAVAGALLAQFAGLYLAPLRDLLGTVAVAPADLLVICAVSCLGYVAVRLDRLVLPERRRAARA